MILFRYSTGQGNYSLTSHHMAEETGDYGCQTVYLWVRIIIYSWQIPIMKGSRFSGTCSKRNYERKGNPPRTYHPSQDEADPSAGTDPRDIHQDRRTYK